MSFQLWRLGWYNFERLVQALLKEEIGPGVETFGGSKDGGRDAAFRGKALGFPSRKEPWAGNWIFQAKFIDTEKAGMEASAKRLLATFRREMVSITKGHRSPPDNYVLWTNVEVTSSQRDEVHKIAADTLGKTVNFGLVDGVDITALLNSNPLLRRSFPQLLGLADLDFLLNRELYNRSLAFVQNWQPQLATFVQTGPYQQAVKALNEKSFVVLDGPPEAGKTTIAATLALSYAVDGYAVISLTRSGEFHSVYDKSQRQVFVADDAVGSNELDTVKGDDWARDLGGILGCLGHSHKLIWTTRSYILQTALDRTRLEESIHKFPSSHEVLVEVSSYTELEKATMLYNHAKASRLTRNQKKLIKTVGLDLIAHPNFTPERVRQLFSNVLPDLDGVPPAKALEEIKAHFKDPSTRWIKAYGVLGPCEQQFLLALFDQGNDGDPEALRIQYNQQTASILPHVAFDVCVDHLAHSFISVTKSWTGKETINFQHPSLRDLLLRALYAHPAVKLRFIDCLSIKGVTTVLNSLIGTPGATEFGLESDAERSRFLQRIRELASIPTPSENWAHLLILSHQLLKPRSGASNSFTESVAENLLEAVCSDTFFETNTSWIDDSWYHVLSRLYRLLPLSENYHRPSYIGPLSVRLCAGDYDPGLAFAQLFAEFEPIIAKRESWKRRVNDWQDELAQALDRIMTEFPTSAPLLEEDLDSWKDRASSVLELVESCEDILQGEAMSLWQDVERMINNAQVVTVPEVVDDSDEDLNDWVRRATEWTPRSLIADIDDDD